MAEAHNAAALSFAITHDGISVNYDQELLRDIWHSYTRMSKRRFARFKVSVWQIGLIQTIECGEQNDFRAGIFPASALSLLICGTLLIVLYLLVGVDFTCGLTDVLKNYVFYYVFG